MEAEEIVYICLGIFKLDFGGGGGIYFFHSHSIEYNQLWSGMIWGLCVTFFISERLHDILNGEFGSFQKNGGSSWNLLWEEPGGECNRNMLHE